MSHAEHIAPPEHDLLEAQLACVEVGASGVETVLLGPGSAVQRHPGIVDLEGRPLLIAVPGLVEGGRVLAASNLGWYDVDPAAELGLPRSAAVACNDAEAAALGESVLRPGAPDLVFVGLGTGVGGAVVSGGAVEANLFAHSGVFTDRACPCGRTGCVETVAGGWALPTPLDEVALHSVAMVIAWAVDHEPLAVPPLVVLAGGLTAAYPELIDLLAGYLPARQVVGTAAHGTKSAAPWGLRQLYRSALIPRTASA